MKQHITAEQVMSLTPEQRERLREWWRPQAGDIYCEGDIRAVYVIESDAEVEGFEKTGCFPLLSIGQCINLLGDRFLELGKARDKSWVACEGLVPFYAKEPIDALFTAVKEVL